MSENLINARIWDNVKKIIDERLLAIEKISDPHKRINEFVFSSRNRLGKHINSLFETIGKELFRLFLYDTIKKSKSRNIKQNIQNFQFYFWPGYSNIDNQRLALQGLRQEGLFQEYDLCGIGNKQIKDEQVNYIIKYINQESSECLLFQHHENEGDFWIKNIPSSIAYNRVLNASHFDKENGYGGKSYSPAGTSNWIFSQKASGISEFSLKETNTSFMILNVGVHEEDSCSKYQNNSIVIKISEDKIGESGYIVSKSLDKKNFNIAEEQRFIEWPAPAVQSSSDSFDVKTNRKLHKQAYSYWLSETLKTNKTTQSNYDEIINSFKEEGFSEISERIVSFGEIEEQIRKKTEEIYYKNWYTIFLDGHSRNSDLGSAMFFSNHSHSKSFLRKCLLFLKVVYKDLRIIEFNTRKEIETLKLLKQSGTNAIAKVMARNMSHNIGSHVLSRLVDSGNIDIEKFTTGDKPYYTPYSEELCYDIRIQALEDSLRKQDEKETWCGEIKYKARKSYYNQLISIFFSYLKTRQDFLADIVSSVPQVQNSKLFKKELMEGIDSNRILLNRISGVDDFPYKFHFEGEIREDKDLSVAISNDVMGQHAFYIILENIIRNTAKHGNGGSDSSTENIFKIRVKDSELDSSYYQVTIFDNKSFDNDEKSFIKFNKKNLEYINTLDKCEIVISRGNGFNGNESQYDEISKPELVVAFTERLKKYNGHTPELKHEGSDDEYDYYSIRKIDQLIIRQNVWINKSILDDQFKLRQGALGLIEMEACAAYLRRVPVEDIEAERFELAFDPEKIEKNKEEIENGTKELPLFKAINPCKFGKPNERENVLGYQFYLPKPKKLLILDFKGKEWNRVSDKGKSEENLKILENVGVLLLKVGTQKDGDMIKPKWYFNENKTYQHEIMLLIGKKNLNDFSKIIKSHIPSRWITYCDVKKNFERYQSIYNKAKNDKILDYAISYKINQVIKNPDQVLREVWRAYIYKRYEELEIEEAYIKEELSYELLFPKNRKSKEKVNVTIKNHSYDNTDVGPFTSVSESRFDYLKDLIVIENEESMDAFEESVLNGSSFLTQAQFLDAVMSNVCILDERIQEQVQSNQYTAQSPEGPRTEPYQFWWNLQNVFVPLGGKSDGIDLNKKDFPKDLDKEINKVLIEQFRKNKREIKGLKWLVIHLGVIEKIAVKNNLKKDCNDDREKIISQIVEGFDNVKVIITSGRAPKDLPDKIAFLSYSVISQYIIENRFKLLLNEVLNSARPTREQNE